MKREMKFTILTLALFSIIACNQDKPSSDSSIDLAIKKNIEVAPNGNVLTQDQQEAMTPDDVIKILKEGNIQFTNNDLTSRNHSKQN